MLQLLSSDRNLQFQQKFESLTTANIHNENMSKLLSPCLRPRHVVIKVVLFICADLKSQLKGKWPFILEYLIDNNVLCKLCLGRKQTNIQFNQNFKVENSPIYEEYPHKVLLVYPMHFNEPNFATALDINNR